MLDLANEIGKKLHRKNTKNFLMENEKMIKVDNKKYK